MRRRGSQAPAWWASVAFAALFQLTVGAVGLGLSLAMVSTEGRVTDLAVDPRTLARVAVPLLFAFERPLREVFARPDEAAIVLGCASTVLYAALVHATWWFASMPSRAVADGAVSEPQVRS